MTNELKQKLLPPRPPTPPPGTAVIGQPPKGSTSLRPPTPPLSASLLPVATDLAVVKKRGSGVRSWISIDWKGHSKIIEADKVTIMRRCELPARDLRLLDPVFVYPSTILGREKAIVVNLEQIRCIITAEECLVLNSSDPVVQEYKKELQRRIFQGDLHPGGNVHGFLGRGMGGQVDDRTLSDPHDGAPGTQFWAAAAFPAGPRVISDRENDMFSGAGGGGEDQPFEFKALEVALEAACTYLDSQASALGRDAYPLLEQLAYQISTRNLELVRRLKSNLVQLTRRVQKVRDEIEQLMDDDGDMAEMHLTEKKRRAEATSHHGGDYGFGSIASGAPHSPRGRGYLSAPVSPTSSPPRDGAGSVHGGRVLVAPFEREGSYGSQAGSLLSSGSPQSSEVEDVEQLEMLLEAYFVVVDGTLNKLTQMSQYIDDTEDFINIQLDNVRNQLIQFELLLTTATFVITIYGVVAGIFGMNVPLGVEEDPAAFPRILLWTGVSGIVVFCLFLGYFKWKNLTIV